MQDKLEDNHEDYRSIIHEECCRLLSTIEVKENSKRAATHIKRITISKAEPINSERDESVRVPRKKRGENWCPTKL